VTYSDRTPIREDLLNQAVVYIEKYKAKHNVVAYDVQLETWPQANPQPMLINAWCVIITITGALLGEINNLTYTWPFHHSPQQPNEQELETGIREAFQRLSVMKMRQLQAGQPGNAN
jgi:hypothetical protein